MAKLINTSNLDTLAKGLNNHTKELIEVEKNRAMAVEGVLETSINDVRNMFDGRSFRYVTQTEYNVLSQEQKDREDIVWCITDAEDIDISLYQTIQDDSLETDVKTIPGAINELAAEVNYTWTTLSAMIGDGNQLTTTAKDNVVNCINELQAEINQVVATIGDGDKLTTNTKESVVACINELNSKIAELIITVDKVATTNVVQVNISNGILSLTTDRYQKTTMVDGTTISFPTVNEFTEIHLYFDAFTNMNITFPDNCKWRVDPNIEEGSSYEMVATYNTIEWLVNVLVYS